MDAFLAKLSYHATNYAIRSCLALTSTYVIQQGSRLIKTVDDDPLRVELSHLQRRLARKIELISPILESIEFRYARGNSTLEAVVHTAQELRANVDSLGKRLEAAALADQSRQNGRPNGSAAAASVRRMEIQNIIADIKQLIEDIDDSIPLINLWVSAIGGIQTQHSAFSPSRLLQASMLVNVGDTQYILNPGRPMQIGPDFVLSIYMLFRAHASSPEDAAEPYGIEEGQRKPLWQEVIHKARVRLRRIPLEDNGPGASGNTEHNTSYVSYAYELQIVEDLDDGRVHTVEDGNAQPSSYEGVSSAGIREFIPVHQISKMFYADVGRILNINNEDGASRSPVLLLKRDVKAIPPNQVQQNHMSLTEQQQQQQQQQQQLIECLDESDFSDGNLDGDTQYELDRQLNLETKITARTTNRSSPTAPTNSWRLPQDLDPAWIALEVFEVGSDEENDTTDDEDEHTPEEEDEGEYRTEKDHRHHPNFNNPRRLKNSSTRPSADSNLVTQLSRMSIASTSSRSSSRNSGALVPDPKKFDEDLLERSPFGAIQTSLSLLEMMLRLASLQEFEQTTHLAISDHVLRFYLDESISRADADAPVHRGLSRERN
ncbi:Ran-binding-domain-containing protein [Daldinia caldariorum]|uniref:Ran-binding-domain-containing protein n=1 Tax=Daldinia caldariorum TaxID=326644 RepID=UPI0020076BAF|nr:Ran-binding-domain-containing protein [Daldinia caldariorum]KAI1473088.1 Ran-binding-domain-containing protein [Daldinia caldariorum]